MGECVCRVYRQYRRTRRTYQRGDHHEHFCPLYFDPTRIPDHAMQQIAEAETEDEYKRALADEDLMIERCD